MTAERDVVKLQDTKGRVEMLIRYFRDQNEGELALLQELEERLRGVTDALSKAGASSRLLLCPL